jgi:hypothetical protein
VSTTQNEVVLNVPLPLFAAKISQKHEGRKDEKLTFFRDILSLHNMRLIVTTETSTSNSSAMKSTISSR